MSFKSHRRGDTPSDGNFRLHVLRLGFLIFAALIVWRLFTLQVIDSAYYTAMAEGQYSFYKDLYPERGTVYAADLKDGQRYPVATNINLGFVVADPRNVKDVYETANILATIFALTDEELLTMEARLAKADDQWEPLRREVPEEQLAQIDAAKGDGKLQGISYTRFPSRVYPETGFGGQIIGFVGTNDDGSTSGKYGIEGYFDEELAGTAGYLQSERDDSGRLVPVGDQSFMAAVDGADIVLTIDRNIQYTACGMLRQAVLRHGADGGSLVILDPATGAVLTMCGAPDFDPNIYGEVADAQVFNNPAIFNAYEPGSVFKPITMAAAIDAGAVTPSTTFEDVGFVDDVGCETPIRNSEDKVYGTSTMTKVLEESINTGVIFAMKAMGREVFADYVNNFGFGVYSGIELDKEVPGNVSSLKQKSDCYAATASFGQGITVTLLQLAAAYVPLANGGKLMQPFVVQEIDYADGRVEKTEPIAIRQVVSDKTANLLSAVLISVVENGHGKKAQVPGYYIAGKTGTAQVAGAGGSYSTDNTIGSFAGYGPVGDPRFVMVTRIDHPRDVQYAESTAAPLFGEIAEFLLRYFEVPPQR